MGHRRHGMPSWPFARDRIREHNESDCALFRMCCLAEGGMMCIACETDRGASRARSSRSLRSARLHRDRKTSSHVGGCAGRAKFWVLIHCYVATRPIISFVPAKEADQHSDRCKPIHSVHSRMSSQSVGRHTGTCNDAKRIGASRI